MLDKYQNEEILMITPNSNKISLIKQLIFYNIKYMTIEEFKNNYFYSYNNRALEYLVSKYHYNLDVSKVIISNLYDIDINKSYKSKKLNNLVKIKKDLLNNKLLTENLLFKASLKKRKIIVSNYNNLEKYLEDALKKEDALFLEQSSGKLTNIVMHCYSLEDEISFVLERIISLIKKGVSLNNIYLGNVGESDKYTIRKLFSYFHIPINLNIKTSIYGMQEVTNYIKDKTLNLEHPTNVTPLLINVINSLNSIEDSAYYEIFLKSQLKSTYFKEEKYHNAINIIDINEVSLTENDYLFVIGFNQDILPKTYKDEDFISDNLKEEINYYSTNYKNKRSKTSTVRILSSITNLTLSYHDKDNFNTYLKSSLITELNLEEQDYINTNYNYSNIYNSLNLAISLDQYYKYKEVSTNLVHLYKKYHSVINYNTYSNQFSGVSNEKLLSFIKEPLIISYTSLNNYNKCAFSYYIKHLLKIDSFEDTFSLFLGNLFHYLASISLDDNFDFEFQWNKYLEDKDLNIKEKYFLVSLKKQIKDALDIIKSQSNLSGYKNYLFEQSISIDLDKKLDVIFNGKIDKIMYRKNISDTYFAVVDYKTGNIDTSINNMKYGIGMQLVIYLYLISCSKLFDSAIFTGMYFQRVLHPSYKWEKNKDLMSIKKNELKLMGYSTNNQTELEMFDDTYNSSEIIKGMRTLKNGEIDSRSKVLTDEDILNILKYSKKIINETVDKILVGEFIINPKVIDNKDISCSYCKYKDICYVKESDKVYLDKVDNLDFLGGDFSGHNLD